MMNAELCGSLTKGEAVRHQAEQAALGEVVKLDGSAAADGAARDLIGIERGIFDFFARGLVVVANNSGVTSALNRNLLVGRDRHNQNAVRGLWQLRRLDGQGLRPCRSLD